VDLFSAPLSRVLDELTALRSAPAHIRSDNGPEFVSAVGRDWCEESRMGSGLDR
jgi:hypothetical protein